MRHSPELYCSQLTYSGVTLSLGWLDSTARADGRRLRRPGRLGAIRAVTRAIGAVRRAVQAAVCPGGNCREYALLLRIRAFFEYALFGPLITQILLRQTQFYSDFTNKMSQFRSTYMSQEATCDRRGVTDTKM